VTTYQSQAVTTKDRDGNELTFKTLNIDGEEAVLAVAVDVELPDGQQVTVNVLFEEADVCGLLDYLHDNFGGRGVKPAADDALRMPDYSKVTVKPEDLQDPGNGWAAGDTAFSPILSMGAEVIQAMTARRCAVIYNGVQCENAEHSPTVLHSFLQEGLIPQNDAGTATPPADAQGATNTPQAGASAQSAAESATGAGTPEAAPASQPTAESEKPKRKRRTKPEIAYDEALKVWKEGKGDSVADGQTLSEAYEALKAKDPGNSRLVQTVAAQQVPEGMPLTSNPDEAQPAPVGFAPEQPAPNANYVQQMQSPINQEFATWASNLPGEHHQDSVFMTPEQAATVTAFQPGQTPQLGQVTVSPEEQQAAQGFPCPVRSSDNRPCQRPYGHELATAANPQPKPHVYATTDPSQLGQPWTGQNNSLLGDIPPMPTDAPAPVTDPLPWTPGPGSGFPTGPLSFQVPPTPDAAPHPETNLQPPAPAAPSWSAPV
jgi:hypothetical protein